ncbi:hypothetical protein C0995_007391, partial [Termitomyces sp. Mi166
MSNLAVIIRKGGKLEEAEKLQQEVLKAQMEADGSSHPETIQAMSNLAVTLWQSGQLKEAQMLQQKVLKAQ